MWRFFAEQKPSSPMVSWNVWKGFPFLMDYSGVKSPRQARITEISLPISDSFSLRTKVLDVREGEDSPVIYLQHGMSVKGIDDARILALGNNLANRGFRVYLPELPEVKALLVREKTISNIRSAFLRIHSLERRPVAYVSASFSAGMGFVGLADPQCQEILSSLLLIGTYSDFSKTVPFVLKNFEVESYAVNVMMFNYVHLIRSRPEGLQEFFFESALDNGLHRSSGDRKGPQILNTLSVEDRSFVKNFLEISEFREETSWNLKARAPESFVEETSPAFFAHQYRRPCYLLHGDDDPVISPQESKDLRDLLSKNPGPKPVFLETSLLTHGDHLPLYARLSEILPMADFWGGFLFSARS
ncbi:alpha/beta hydrolase [Leptospira gomenensis]|uniref:Alpha/beta hydrolase n=1 Tax=Leptospira gomenensis TaxID=2484974 RepID=A0A5F1Z1Y5_9LEPT|nr:alpha/beta hydrolase [Leptospira gomenensis]TGK39346.1 alpha/beta hydrolase [Leptospira gomenensis]TGK44094.1 alpha/beta hydrolase [Leptospira gomenensis]TGK44287.1 alpha/beta hydrolase [Leptospira gomenensis]TGK65868.1 alpha/beta hydrolase [Leptospira gomenensis]